MTAEPAPDAGPGRHARRCTAATCVPQRSCGSIKRPWEPGNPAAGTVTVGFAFVPARDQRRPALGTLVPHEGGPGYSTTGTGASYAAMYGPLLDRRNLLLVDQRGTGRSEPIDCPALQDREDRRTPSRPSRLRRQLGDRADDYTTALSADDLAAVVRALRLGRVDVYGDSYGTFFAQVFAGRHPELVRSVVLDSAYPTYGENAWYPTQGPAMRRAFARRVPALAGLPQRRRRRSCRTLRAGARAGARQRRGAAGLRRRRSPDAGHGGRARPGGGRVRRDVHAGVLPRADRRAALRRCRATARRCCGWSPRRPAAAPTPGPVRPTARAWTRRSPATTTRSSTT